jgi:hypothetical protein
MLMEDPSLAMPYVERVEPKRMNPRIDVDEPKDT